MEEMAEFGGQTTLLNEMSQQGSKVLDTRNVETWRTVYTGYEGNG
jgi:hypothetical protein